MTRREFVEALQKEGKDKEAILQALIKGDAKKGVNPIKGESVAEKMVFAKLIYGRVLKQIQA